MNPMITSVERSANGVRMIDQRKLPLSETHVECTSPEEVADAIRDMVVRGAPAIGIAAAFGLALAATRAVDLPEERFDERLEQAARLLIEARPTAVNLAWAVRRLHEAAGQARARGDDNQAIARLIEDEAELIREDDLAACRTMGKHGADLVPNDANVLTHCNAGGLATAGYGTALGVVRGAIESGKKVRVFADETRPFLQGSRLTAWELLQDDIETVLITDNSAGSLMRAGKIDLVIVGADRIAANGDVANKIGTYSVAVLAHANNLPFYVAAPMSTIDFDCPDGDRIPIEQRDAREVTEPFGIQVAPPGVQVCNPAFDVTPARYVSAIITERGIARPPYLESLAALASAAT